MSKTPIHEPGRVEALAGKHAGQTALIVAGGSSGVRWQDVLESTGADIVIGCNGAPKAMNEQGRAADYALDVEYTSQSQGWFLDDSAKVRLINKAHHHLVTKGAIAIHREPIDGYDGTVDLHKYGAGFISGPRLGVVTKDHVGTVVLQALHLACILGVSKVHTLGYDLCFRPADFKQDKHHWYSSIRYIADDKLIFENEAGRVLTRQIWIDTSRWMIDTFKPWAATEGMQWHDCSNGLIDMLDNGCVNYPEVRYGNIG